MKFTEFIKDYVKKHPGVKYKDAMKDKKVRCLWHEHRSQEIGCPTKCAQQIPQVVPDMSQSRPYRMLPRPVEMQPAEYSMPQIPTRASAASEVPHYQNVPAYSNRSSPYSLGNFGKREEPEQLQLATREPSRGASTFLSSLLPSNLLHSAGEFFSDIYPSDVTSSRVEQISETPHIPKRRGRPLKKTQVPLLMDGRAPVKVSDVPNELQVDPRVNRIQQSLRGINIPTTENLYPSSSDEFYGGLDNEQTRFLKSLNFWRKKEEVQTESNPLRKTQTQSDHLSNLPRTNRRLQQIRQQQDLVRRQEQQYGGPRPTFSDEELYGDTSDMPGLEGFGIRGGMAEGLNPVIKYPQYKNRHWVEQTAASIHQRRGRPLPDQVIKLDKEYEPDRNVIDDIRRMELHRRYHLEDHRDLPAAGNERVRRTDYLKPTDAKNRNQFFDQLGLREYWLSPDVQKNKHTQYLFGEGKDSLLKQYREGSGKRGKRDGILDDSRWLKGAPSKDERLTKQIRGIQEATRNHPMYHPSFTDKRPEDMTEQQIALTNIASPRATLARLAEGAEKRKEDPIFRSKEAAKKLEIMFPQMREERLAPQREQREKNKKRKQEELESGQVDRRIRSNPAFERITRSDLEDIGPAVLQGMDQYERDYMLRRMEDRGVVSEGTAPALDAQTVLANAWWRRVESGGVDPRFRIRGAIDDDMATEEDIEEALRVQGPNRGF